MMRTEEARSSLPALFAAGECGAGHDEAISAADEHLRRREWKQVVEALDAAEGDAGAAVRGCFARNMMAMERHRPALYRMLTESRQAETVCQLGRSPAGLTTIVQTAAGRDPMVLSHGGEPVVATSRIVDSLREPLTDGRCLALCGVGDGYVLTHFAAHPPALIFGQQQCIHIVEPQPEVLLAAMMIHDWSGPDGPIEDRRFQWWVGSSWADELYSGLDSDSYLPYPERSVRLGMTADAVDAALRDLLAMLIKAEERTAQRVSRRYARLDGPSLAVMFGADAPRPPRVLLLTTRFSTVLQHSTRDLAAAFEQAGWATRTPIEPSDHHRHSRRNVLRHLADFEPDLVVQIDHLRHEHRDRFPPQLPFACWIQDDLPNLMRREAGAAVGVRDFVWTTSQAVYEHDYGYPGRQCIYMPKATRLPDLNRIARRDAPDVVYVSNASATAAECTDELLAECASSAELTALIRGVSAHLTEVYAQGGSVYTIGEMREIILGQAAAAHIEMRDGGAGLARLAGRLFASINNALYRQQAMEWAARACERSGLTLGLYGAGWERHPALGRFARGPVNYGHDLESLTRSAKINLQVVPYMFLHQRWLDGIAAGGFFLVRAHPMDTLAPEVATFIEAHFDESITTLAEANAAVTGEAQVKWRELVERRCRYDDHRGTDPVALYRAHRLEGRDYIYESPAHLSDVRFDSRAGLERLLRRFAADATGRAAIAQQQREYVAEHLTYEAGVRRAVARMADLLANEPAAAPCESAESKQCA